MTFATKSAMTCLPRRNKRGDGVIAYRQDRPSLNNGPRNPSRHLGMGPLLRSHLGVAPTATGRVTGSRAMRR
jgi:hypothetical protein